MSMAALITWPDGEAAGRDTGTTTVSGYRIHGDFDSAEAVGLITGRMAGAAERLGCRHKSGGNDATTYLFPAHDAAVDFLAEVTRVR